MAVGDRYDIPHYTQGPKKTKDAMNADIDILKDLNDRVLLLEEGSTDAAGIAGMEVIAAVIRNGQAGYVKVKTNGDFTAF